MTTIACDGKTMAGDTQITEDDVVSRRIKVFKKGDCIIGFAGCYTSGMMWVGWFGTQNEKPDYPGEFDGLVLYKNGKLYRTGNSGYMDLVPEGIDAVGSGQHIALALMEHGKTAHQAVSYCCKKLASCSKPITLYRAAELVND